MTFEKYCENVYDKFNIEVKKQDSEKILSIDSSSILLSQYFDVLEHSRQSHCKVDICDDNCVHKEIEYDYKKLGEEMLILNLSITEE